MKAEEKLMSEESKIRKVIWERKAAVDAKMAEPGFETLKKPGVWSAEAFGEGGYEVVSHEKEEEYRKRAEEENRSRRPEMYADECKPVWDGRN